jgi:trehalose 6-phosphate phosphatase
MALPFLDCSSRRLDEIVQDGLLCVFDFDGTLAPLVTRPEKARVPLGILLRVMQLSNYAPVGIISGRSLTDIRACLGFEPNFVVGNHGLEGLPREQHAAQSHRKLCRVWEQTLATAFSDAALFEPGLWIENKGFSLSIHYRMTRDHAKAERQLSEVFARMTPSPHVIAGKCVFNLLPQDAGNKGWALEQLMQVSGARSAIYVGDDVTDEDVFRLPRRDLLSVRIGPVTSSAAEFYLPHRLDIFQLLDNLINRLRRAGTENWIHAEAAGTRQAAVSAHA